jgi:catechol 2,3-dioxygenase-like lactoylglutathione lyase family enzyme
MVSQGYFAVRMKLSRILETALYTPNLEEAEAFYAKLLELEPYHREGQRHVFFKLDEAMLLLFNPETTLGDNQGIPAHGARGQGHLCFQIEEAQIEAWKSRLAELGIPIEVEHTWPNGSKSLYFRDPAGNSIELAPWRIWSRYG